MKTQISSFISAFKLDTNLWLFYSYPPFSIYNSWSCTDVQHIMPCILFRGLDRIFILSCFDGFGISKFFQTFFMVVHLCCIEIACNTLHSSLHLVCLFITMLRTHLEEVLFVRYWVSVVSVSAQKSLIFSPPIRMFFIWRNATHIWFWSQSQEARVFRLTTTADELPSPLSDFYLLRLMWSFDVYVM